MSIYRGRTGRSDYDDVHEVPIVHNARVRGPSPDPSPDTCGRLQCRKAKPVDRLLPLSDRLLDRLPLHVCPRQLATQYPRIVNLIALQWNDSNACSAYLEELLVDRRGARQGFPSVVELELVKLRDYWFRRELTPEE
jgi:hypothetical protein